MQYNTVPPSYGKVDFEASKFQFLGGVLFGSRATNSFRDSSDYDYVIHAPILDKILKDEQVKLSLSKLSHHFNCIPPYGDNYIIKDLRCTNGSVDLIVMEHKEHVDSMHKINTEVLTNNTTLMLKDENIRRPAYEKAMLNNGYIRNNFISKLWYKLFNKGQ